MGLKIITVIHPLFLLYHLLDLALDLIQLLALDPTHPHNRALLLFATATAPTSRRSGGWGHGVSHDRGYSSLPSRPYGRGQGRSSSRHTSYCVLSLHSIYTHSIIPPPFPGSLQGSTFSLAFFDNDFQHMVNHCIPLVESTNNAM